jgi:signal recognition particle subunit SRP54
LFEELKELIRVSSPDHIVYVMDACVGQSAEQQVQAFQRVSPIGSIVLTKWDGTAKGGAVLSIMATSNCPVHFIGTGEGLEDFQLFNSNEFLDRLLCHETSRKTKETRSCEGYQTNEQSIPYSPRVIFSFRELQGLLTNMSQLDLTLFKSLPFAAGLPHPALGEFQSQVKDSMILMDAMSQAELDADSQLFYKQKNRILRLARGSGRSIAQVEEFLAQFRKLQPLAARSNPKPIKKRKKIKRLGKK